LVRASVRFSRPAIENVLRNAIRYAPQGTAVEAGLEAADGRAVVRIRDYWAGLVRSIARRAVELDAGSIRARMRSRDCWWRLIRRNRSKKKLPSEPNRRKVMRKQLCLFVCGYDL
jgi:nucleoside 2-deoxyribosyltransferase